MKPRAGETTLTTRRARTVGGVSRALGVEPVSRPAPGRFSRPGRSDATAPPAAGAFARLFDFSAFPARKAHVR